MFQGLFITITMKKITYKMSVLTNAHHFHQYFKLHDQGHECRTNTTAYSRERGASSFEGDLSQSSEQRENFAIREKVPRNILF